MNAWEALGLAGLGGSAGALLRYGTGKWAAALKAKPYAATLTVNLTGSLLIGVLAGMEWKARQPELYALLGPGVMGGLTTYSTLNVQKATMRTEKRYAALAKYAAATYLGGWLAFAIGFGIGKAAKG
ncbi:fluoride efflux transporter FluC [Cohnella thailandensis]|uniref:Fluoride-specific ion channel FluC n=1 Tax=Cohnella thailandensis TaxID=557557 RepID=A0A841SWX4_9BACL|nr:CrcB family protein [Cohnella thailandensis]MBB6636414.1 CrcB family protein [Cohnella thailandensis]MBP1973615.1 CrcB protein [Cohnella thailandensis]